MNNEDGLLQSTLENKISELRPTGPKLVLFLAIRCLLGVHLTEGQSDPKSDQMPS